MGVVVVDAAAAHNSTLKKGQVLDLPFLFLRRAIIIAEAQGLI